jgi:hypothetical protein
MGSKLRKIIVGGCAGSLMMFGLASSASAASFNFTGGAGVGSIGNSLAFGPVSGVTVTATAWYLEDFSSDSGDNFAKAALGQYSGGLGVCTSAEESGDDTPFDNCGSPQHAVDNLGGQQDFILFVFSQAVDLGNLTIGWYDDDRDVNWWMGNGAPTSLLGIDFDDLGANGFGPMQTSTNSSSFALDNTTATFTKLLVSARLEYEDESCGLQKVNGQWQWVCTPTYNDDTNDAVKISGLTFEVPRQEIPSVPEPGTLVLFGLGLSAVVVGIRRRRE